MHPPGLPGEQGCARSGKVCHELGKSASQCLALREYQHTSGLCRLAGHTCTYLLTPGHPRLASLVVCYLNLVDQLELSRLSQKSTIRR
jgi:hypothetical protein